MANLQLVISGTIALAKSQLPATGIKIELWDATDSNGLIGTTHADKAGNFSFYTNSPISDLIAANTINLGSKTYRGNVLIPNTTNRNGNAITISIEEQDYDNEIKDIEPSEPISYISISGAVMDSNFNPANGVTVNVYEKGFRSETLLAQTSSNISGQYTFKISTRSIANSVVIGDRTIVVRAYNGTSLIARTDDLYPSESNLTDINLYADSNVFSAPSQFESIISKISYVLDGVTFNDFAAGISFNPNTPITDGSIPDIEHHPDPKGVPEDGNSNGELSYVAKAAGLDFSIVQQITKAYQFAVQSSVGHDFLYALIPQTGIIVNPIITMNEDSLRSGITLAIAENLIPPHSQQEINGFITAAKAYQVLTAKAIPIIGETYGLGTILNSIFGGITADSDTTEFLSKYNNDFSDIDAFWNYYSQFDPVKAELAKRGLQLATITGFQPEMINALMSSTTNGMFILASWSENDWITYINNVCTTAGKLCVPSSIIGNLTDPVAIKALYAKKLSSVTQDLYPLTSINVMLGDAQQGATIIPDANIRAQVINFIDANPKFDLRISSVYDINEDNQDVDVSSITDVEEVQQAMAPIQRMLRLVGGNTTAIATLIAEGLGSYTAIAEVHVDDFTAQYANLLGGVDSAYAAHGKAVALKTVSTISFTNLYQANVQIQAGVLSYPTRNGQQDPHLDPNIKTLFGSTSYCACEQCLSVYSPAAYYTDIMNFMRAGIPGSPLPNIYNELIRRRPDLEHIDMTCKNTNTVIPYIDLVIELLEMIILKNIPQSGVPLSFQTSGTVKELAAHPEHIYKEFATVGGVYTWNYRDYPNYVQVYNPSGSANLTNAVYPFNLPFSLPAQETRTYLGHLGYSRYETMKMFQEYITPTSISDFDIYAELLTLTEIEAQIIANIHPSASSTWLFYGFNSASVTNFIDPADTSAPLISDAWDHLLTNRLDVLIQQLKMSYKQFLQFLTSDFLNKPVSGTRQITVTSKDASVPDTCDITKLKLVFTGTSTPAVFLNKLHRFVRLWNTNKMSVEDWDKLFTSLFVSNLNDTDFALIGRVLQIADRTGMKLTELGGWWYYINIHQYVDYASELQTKQPSTYDLLYRNRAVINVPLPDFGDLGSYDPTSVPLSSLPAHYTGFTAQIAAASGITETDLLLILNFMSITDLSVPVGLGQLSSIYFVATLSKKVGYTVSDFLKVLHLLKITIDPPVTAQIFVPQKLDKINLILNTIDTINNSSFTLLEIDYIVENFGETGPAAPAPLNIQFFFEKLRNELQKFPIYDGPIPALSPMATPEQITAYNTLVNIIYQAFSKEFSVPSEWVSICFGAATSYLTTLLSSDFVESTTPLLPDVPVIGSIIYKMYLLAYKYALITRKFRLNTAEFEYFFQNAYIFDFGLIRTSGLLDHPNLGTLFNGFLQMSRWINVRDKLSLIEDQLVILLKAANDDVFDVHASMATWQSIINRPQWGTMLATLIGNSSATVESVPAGLLNARFPNDFSPSQPASINKLWNVINIMTTCLRTGLSPTTLRAALLQGLSMSESHQVLLAAKGKHTEDEWNAIAKPLMDTLRTKQRDALVGFVVSHPNPAFAANVQKWRNENDLYAFLLIDVEMEACMKTSRIKQAISSAQLYLDRVILGLEYRNGNVFDRITLPVNMQKQWEAWRAWYRIWEANRKVFLYPENWIEPELRDDKSVFFTEMEDKLFQGDVTQERSEDALFEYLKKLEEVAKLEPMALCDTKDPVTYKIITHALVRTYGQPHKYFYRKLVNNQWTPWERLEIEVKGEHMSMIVWQNQLYLFWLTMREKQAIGRKTVINNVIANDGYTRSKWFYNDQGRPNTDTSVNNDSPVYIKQIEITVNWSVYKEGKWGEHQIGNEKMSLDINPIIHDYYSKMFPALSTTGAPAMSPALLPNTLRVYQNLTNGRALTLSELIISKLGLATFENHGGGNIFLMIQMSNEFFSEFEYGENIHAFTFSKDRGVKIWDSWFGGNIPAPARLIYKNNKFVQFDRLYDPTATTSPLDVAFYTHNLELTSTPSYHYPTETLSGSFAKPHRVSANPIFSKSPNGKFSVFGHSNIEIARFNVLQKGFFYNDGKYGFFARPVNIPTTGAMSLASAAETASSYYFNGSVITATYGTSISLTSVFATQKYYMQSFFHGRASDFLKTLNSGGIDGFMNIQTQDQTNTLNFNAYLPSSLVYGAKTPVDKVDFDYDGAYAGYNWELFFHMPLLVAKRLSDNQQFEDARKWYHYIFDPTSSVDAYGSPSNSKQRFWRFRPFYDAAGAAITSVDDLLMQIHMGNAAALDQLQVWMDNPFKPHVIARMRILAYMKNVVMCYMDNLIAWADKLYRQDTIESINQATNLYIVVSNILGDRPQEVPKRISTGPRTFSELAAAGLDAFSNAMVGIENYIDPNSGPLYVAGGSGGPIKGEGPELIKLFYYCLPNNPKLLAYWDTIANRLFNIRNCRNIDGQRRELPLYDAPIDPALLVRAAAAGIDASSVLDDLSSPPMPYRFFTVLQKANELCNDVKSLGGALLSALEKKDAEELSLLRSGQEIAVMESMKRMKQVQIDEAAANIDALVKSKEVALTRYNYYSSRTYKSPREIEHLVLMDASQKHQNAASTLSAIGSVLSILPELNVQAPFAIGPSFGGRELSAVFSALSTIQSQKAAAKSAEANKTLTEAGYERRRDDWQFQAESAQQEMAQIDKQILAAQIRKNITERDLETQELQITNAKSVDEYMHQKYTNMELYSWMVGQISSTYFQAYQFAYDVAKRAEKCLKFEVPWINTPGTGFIKFGYWDSLKKGLMSGEKLQYDLRKLELGYLEANTRELELTKHISLAMESPAQLLELRSSGMCSFDCDRNLFDLDYPGHYQRRIKSISISIPCVSGPYMTIAAMLTQSNAMIEDESGSDPTATFTSPARIAMSGAQNDSGVFELSMKDERYLPFEGSGAICTWNLSMMEDKTLRQFDYNTISDVIIHVKYTAAYSNVKETLRIAALHDAINGIGAHQIPLHRYFSVKHEFANAWYAYATAFAIDPNAEIELKLNGRMFPYLCNGKNININSLAMQFRFKAPTSAVYDLSVNAADGAHTTAISYDTLTGMHTALVSVTVQITPTGNQTFWVKMSNLSAVNVNMNDLLDDIYLVATYKLSLP